LHGYLFVVSFEDNCSATVLVPITCFRVVGLGFDLGCPYSHHHWFGARVAKPDTWPIYRYLSTATWEVCEAPLTFDGGLTLRLCSCFQVLTPRGAFVYLSDLCRPLNDAWTTSSFCGQLDVPRYCTVWQPSKDVHAFGYARPKAWNSLRAIWDSAALA